MITDTEARTYAEGLRGYLDRHFGGELDPIPDDALSMAADLVEYLAECVAPEQAATRDCTVAFRLTIPADVPHEDIEEVITNAYAQFDDAVVREQDGAERRVPILRVNYDVGSGVAVMLPTEVWTRVREVVDYHLSTVEADPACSEASRVLTEHLVVDALR